MKKQWQQELERYLLFTQQQKLLWLSRLLFVLTVFARDTYEIGTDGVCKPEELRCFNELFHRISSKQLTIAADSLDGMPDKQLFQLVSSEIERLGIDSEGLLSRLR